MNASANPDQIRQFLRNASIAYAHRINESLIARATTVGATTGVESLAVTGVNDTSLHTNVLEAIAFAVASLRGRGDYSRNQTFDVLLPLWVREASMLDIGRRIFYDLPLAEANLRKDYAAFGANVHFIDDWQQLTTAANPTPPPNLLGPWPTSAQALIYVPGNFAHLTSNVIDINTIYDSTLLTTNRFTAQFTEQGLGLLVGCEPSYLVTLPTCPSGATGQPGNVCSTDVDLDLPNPAP